MSGSQTTRPRRRYSFPMAPKKIYWEITRACPLACTSCSFGAVPNRHPRELTTDEGKALLREIQSFSSPPPDLVVTGGDPLCREDTDELLSYAHELGIDVVLWVGPTGHLTKSRLKRVQAAGVRAIALPLDDVGPNGHDRTHVHGAFERTIKAIDDVREVGLELQINTMITDESLVDVPKVFDRIQHLNVAQWNLFFLVRMGGAKSLPPVNPLQAEVLMNWMYETSRTATFPIEVMEAPQYRRIVFQRLRDAGVPLSDINKAPQADHFGLRDGNGMIHISHVGDVYPSLFLPVVAGNLRGRSLVSLYRRSRLFRELRDSAKLKGDCGRCKYRRICGGSRARAYAEEGDWSVADPLCSYQPVGVHQAY